MNRFALIPRVDTRDLDPKTSWVPPHLPTGEVEHDSNSSQLNDNTPSDNQDNDNGEKKDDKKKDEQSLVLKMFLSIVIIGAIIGIGILLPIKVIPGISSMFASVFHSRANTTTTNSDDQIENIEFTATPDRITSGGQTKISWNGPVREDGKYSLDFACLEDVKVVLIAADGTKPEILCGESFYFLSIDNTMTLEVTAPNNHILDLPLNFSYVNAEEKTSDLGELELTIANDENLTGDNRGQVIVANDTSGNSSNGVNSGVSNSNTVSQNTGSGYYFDSEYSNNSSQTVKPSSVFDDNSNSSQTFSGQTQTQTVSRPAQPTRADLSVRIIAVGILDKSTGAFIPRSTFNTDDRLAVQFEIKNQGGTSSGTWQFSTVLPTVDYKVYQSALQPSLPAYSGTILTLGFDGVRSGNIANLTIQADSQNRISELNENNNSGTATFYIANSGTNGGRADLKASLIATGRMSGSRFIEDDDVSEGDDAAIQFKVTNIGGTSSGTWRFTALKTDEDDNDSEYESNFQNSLSPGQSATLTITYRDIQEGDYDVEIEVDPDHDVSETNRNNNDINTSLEIDN